MGFYQDQIVPLLINLTMRRRDLAAYRSRVVPAAGGRVLEIGIGSGLNLPFYSRDVERLVNLDPSPKLLSMVRRNLRPDAPSLELIEGSAEAIPLENNSVDTVVTCVYRKLKLGHNGDAVRQGSRGNGYVPLVELGARMARPYLASDALPTPPDRYQAARDGTAPASGQY
jgi:SAM-dependent methyltransferase